MNREHDGEKREHVQREDCGSRQGKPIAHAPHSQIVPEAASDFAHVANAELRHRHPKEQQPGRDGTLHQRVRANRGKECADEDKGGPPLALAPQRKTCPCDDRRGTPRLRKPPRRHARRHLASPGGSANGIEQRCVSSAGYQADRRGFDRKEAFLRQRRRVGAAPQGKDERDLRCKHIGNERCGLPGNTA